VTEHDNSKPQGSSASDTPSSAPFSGKLRTAPTPPDEESDTISAEEPGDGVTDLHGHLLAGDPHGGAMGS